MAHFVVEEMHLLVGGGGLGHESESDTSGGLGSGVEDIEGLEGHGLESGLAVVTFGTVVLDGGGEGGGLVDVSVEPDGHGRRVEESEGTILGSERVERDVVGDEFVSSGLELGDLGLVAVPGSSEEVGSSSAKDCDEFMRSGNGNQGMESTHERRGRPTWSRCSWRTLPRGTGRRWCRTDHAGKCGCRRRQEWH